MRTKQILGEETACRKYGVERLGTVTLAHDETIAGWPVWALWVESKDAAQIQSCKNVRTREIAPGVPDARMMRHGHRAETDQIRLFMEPRGIDWARMAWSRSVVRTWQNGLLRSTAAIQKEL